MSRPLETLVGALVLTIAGVFLFVGLQSRTSGGPAHYRVFADFADATGVRQGTSVQTAGVPIGQVTGISLTDLGLARVTFEIRQGVTIPEESQVAVRANGLIGAPVLDIRLDPTGSPALSDGDQLYDTDPADDLFELLYALAGSGGGE